MTCRATEWSGYIREDRNKNDVDESDLVEFCFVRFVLMMMLQDFRFSQPISKDAQNVCLLFTLHISVCLCGCRTTPLKR